jgi:glycosyltransferase involved in cell wall biosynthesis
MQVSVIIPTYNRADIIRDALESVLAQSYQDFEILVVDDGSSDNTGEVVASVGSNKIRFMRSERNCGCSAAYNRGISEAAGNLIAFLDSDDIWEPGYLEREVDFLARHPEVGVVFCDTEIRGPAIHVSSIVSLMDAFPRFLQQSPKASEYFVDARQMYLCLLQEVPIKPSATTIRREVFSKAGVFDEQWPSGTDWDLFLRMSRVTNFGYIDQALVTQRHRSDATHRRYYEKDKMFLLGQFTKEKATLIGDREALKGVNRGLGALYNSLGWYYLEGGQNKKALSTYLTGYRETFYPKLLRKLASGVFRMTFKSAPPSTETGK